MADELSAPYEGNYLHADDVPAPATVTVREIVPANTEKDARGQVIKDALLAFEKTEKKLVLNKTNFRLGRIALDGKPLSKWPGEQIQLGVRYIDAFGIKDLPCVRILPGAGKRLPKGLLDWFGREHPSQR